MIDMLALASTAPLPTGSGALAFIDRYFGLFLGGGGLVLLGVVLTVRATKGKTRVDDLQGRFTSATAFDAYIDERIERVAKPLREELEKLRNRELSTKVILYAFFQRLMWWDERGRVGTMPMPDADDLTKLGVDLADFGTTQDHDTVRDAVARMRDRQTPDDNVTPIVPPQNGTVS